MKRALSVKTNIPEEWRETPDKNLCRVNLNDGLPPTIAFEAEDQPVFWYSYPAEGGKKTNLGILELSLKNPDGTPYCPLQSEIESLKLSTVKLEIVTENGEPIEEDQQVLHCNGTEEVLTQIVLNKKMDFRLPYMSSKYDANQWFRIKAVSPHPEIMSAVSRPIYILSKRRTSRRPYNNGIESNGLPSYMKPDGFTVPRNQRYSIKSKTKGQKATAMEVYEMPIDELRRQLIVANQEIEKLQKTISKARDLCANDPKLSTLLDILNDAPSQRKEVPLLDEGGNIQKGKGLAKVKATKHKSMKNDPKVANKKQKANVDLSKEMEVEIVDSDLEIHSSADRTKMNDVGCVKRHLGLEEDSSFFKCLKAKGLAEITRNCSRRTRRPQKEKTGSEVHSEILTRCAVFHAEDYFVKWPSEQDPKENEVRMIINKEIKDGFPACNSEMAVIGFYYTKYDQTARKTMIIFHVPAWIDQDEIAQLLQENSINGRNTKNDIYRIEDYGNDLQAMKVKFFSFHGSEFADLVEIFNQSDNSAKSSKDFVQESI